MTMLRLSPLILFAVAPAPAFADGGVTLVHRTPLGQELAVEESNDLQADVEFGFSDFAGGKSKAKGKLVEQKVRVYNQLLVEAPEKGPRKLELLFETATKETMKPNGKDRVKAPTSLHKKRVMVEIDGHTLTKVQPTAGAVTDEDRNDLCFAEKLYSTLPDGEVRPGKVWAIDPETAGRALFGAGYDPAAHSVEGKCKYLGAADAGGRKCAKILVQLKAIGRFGDNAAMIELAPEGNLLFALDDGFIQSYELAGPVRLTASDKAGALSITGTGRMTLKYRAKPTDAGKPDAKEKGETGGR